MTPTPTYTPTATATPTETPTPEPTATPTPEPTAVPTVAYAGPVSGRQLSRDEALAVFAEAGVPSELRMEFLAVACGYGNTRWPNGESTCYPERIGDSGRSWGLFQINIRYHLWRLGTLGYALDPALLLDPVINTRVALQIHVESGWGPWSVKP